MTDAADDAWLDPPEELSEEEVREIVRNAVLDESPSRKPHKYPAVPAGVPATERKLIESLRAITPLQRSYLRAYIQAGCTHAAAERLLRAAGRRTPERGSPYRWFAQPRFRLAFENMRRYYLDATALDPATVMLRANKVYEEAMTPRPLFHDGKVIGETAPDLTNAMRSIEFAGKVNRMTTGDEQNARVTLNIVNLADRQARDVEVVDEQ